MSEARLERTPRLAAVLNRLRAGLARLAWIDGSGRVLLVVGSWVGATFLLDWALELPRAVRVAGLVGLSAVVAVTLWRRLVVRLRELPGPAGLAVLAERGLSQREELLVSAVELQGRRDPDTPALTAALSARVFERADAAAAALDPGALLETRAPARRLALGLCAVAVAALPLVLSPLSHVFLARFLGSGTAWPQRTTLGLEVVSGAIVENPGEERLRLLVPRGGDLALAVRAVDGSLTPESVELRSRTALPQVLAPDGRGVFRAVLRSVTRADVLEVRGGDDDDGTPSAEIVVVDPPDLAALVLEVVPPDYTGLPARRFVNTGATALVGSTLRVLAATTPADARAALALLPSDRVVEPERVPVPADLVDVLGEAPVLVHETIVTESLRLRFELTDERGLESPDPGLFAVDAIEDRAPEVVRVVPTRSDVETSVDGAVRVVLLVRDDFGLADLSYTARAGADGPVLDQGRVEAVPAPEGGEGEWHATLRLEVPRLLGEGEGLGSQLAIQFEATDRARPPQVGKDDGLVVRVLSQDELMRRVKDRLGRARTQASALSERLVESRRRTEELASLAQEAELVSGDDATGLRTALAGARRCESDGRALLRELTSVCELVLYARLDGKAGALLEALDRELADQRSRTFEAEPWRRLVAQHQREPLAADGFGAHLVSIAALALELSDGPLTAGALALDDAAAARDPETLVASLVEASDAARDGVLLVEALLERLSEWDNYQSVLSLTRDLLERQKALSERTKRFASDR